MATAATSQDRICTWRGREGRRQRRSSICGNASILPRQGKGRTDDRHSAVGTGTRRGADANFRCPSGSIFLLTESKDPAKLRRDLIKALRDDPRVGRVDEVGPSDSDFAEIFSVFPAARDDDATSALVSGGDQRRSVQFWRPIAITLHVPAKNQPNHTPFDDIAAEDYVALWDGFTAVVAWEQSSTDVAVAGGQVLEEILTTAAKAAASDLYVQACSPSCLHLFNHVNLVVEHDSAVTEVTYSEGSERYEATVRTQSPVTTTGEAAGVVYYDVGRTLEAFARMKSLGRRVLDLEYEARGELLGLMRLQYQRAHIWEHPLYHRPFMRWKLRGWRKESRVAMARLWVILTAVEEVRRAWVDGRRRYQEVIDESPGRARLFAEDEADDTAAITSLDTGSIERGIAEASDRLDQGAIVLATAGSGVAAIIGVIVGHFL
jgi:hypothetical protein